MTEMRDFCTTRPLRVGDHAGYTSRADLDETGEGFWLLLVNGEPWLDGGGEPMLFSHDHAEELADFWHGAAVDWAGDAGEDRDRLADAMIEADRLRTLVVAGHEAIAALYRFVQEVGAAGTENSLDPARIAAARQRLGSALDSLHIEDPDND